MRPCGTGRYYHCVVLSTDLLSVDIDSDMSVVDECLETHQKMALKKKTRRAANHSLRSSRRCTIDLSNFMLLGIKSVHEKHPRRLTLEYKQTTVAII